MSLLQEMHRICVAEATDPLDAIPEDALTEIKKNITDGAKDTEQVWANALDLVHKSFEVSGVQRPTPTLNAAWKQYETMLIYAVEQLAKFRGMDADWRMSSAMFHEALERQLKFRVVELGDQHGKSHDIEAKSLDDIITHLKDRASSSYDVTITKSKDKENPNGAVMSFAKWGIRNNFQLRITQIV